jgi:hypothetical protein
MGMNLTEEELTLARVVEQQILGDKRPLQCGCVMKILCSFPNLSWVRTLAYYEICSSHSGDRHRMSDGRLPKRIDNQLTRNLNMILQRWLDAYGALVPDWGITAAVKQGFRLGLPRVYMPGWVGEPWQKHGLISLEGDHVIRFDGRVSDRPRS